MCVVGIQEGRYGDWGDMAQELESAFGEMDPEFAWDDRLLDLRQGNKPFAEYISEFRAVAQRSGFAGRTLISVLRYSLSKELAAKVTTENVRGMGFTTLFEMLLRHDQALRATRPWWSRGNQPARPVRNAASPANNNNPGVPNPPSPHLRRSSPEPMGLDRTKDRASPRCFRCKPAGPYCAFLQDAESGGGKQGEGGIGAGKRIVPGESRRWGLAKSEPIKLSVVSFSKEQPQTEQCIYLPSQVSPRHHPTPPIPFPWARERERDTDIHTRTHSSSARYP